MILCFELLFDQHGHAPGNRHFIQMAAAAFPEQEVRVHAAPAHLAELWSDGALDALGPERIGRREVPYFREHVGKLHIVSQRRFRHEFAAFRTALAEVPPGETALLVPICAASTTILAAALAARLRRLSPRGGPTAVQAGLHGNLNELIDPWRARNPLERAFDLRSVLSRPPGGVRFLTFEAAVARELGRLAPAAAPVTDSVPLAVNVSETASWRPAPLEPGRPLEVGLVGIATEAKGIGAYLDIARELGGRHGETRIRFHLAGGNPDGPAPERFAPLAHPVGRSPIDRAEFLARLAPLHHVLLPLQPVYYRLSPSGSLLDALTWLKPVIATRLPIVEDLFAEAGDIGHLCDTTAEMQAVLEAILADPAAAARRHAHQVDNLRAARARREPQALGPAYRAVVERGFPGLFAPRR